ncbi:MAG TPA: AzlC family ABC transporter permease [Acidimicrobiia bacterium]|jgi:predicted branched-subunit amino acid permease|nr:AzlC family ABC transporter permease [Acidimicrobiia bacterium]
MARDAEITLATVAPIGAAIGVFGTLYGAAAEPLLGTWLTVVSSVLIFSGTVQFTMAGLLAASAGPLAVIWAVFVVNVRNFALGAAVRPRLTGSAPARMLVSWFLIDETVGLALASHESADRTLIRTGLVAYLSWVLGTVVGALAGAVLGLEGLASSLFPVLFIGLAALMIPHRSALARALAGAAVTFALLALWPALAGLAPVIGGVAAAVSWGGHD